MGPIAMYQPSDMNEWDDFKVQWIDSGTDDKEKLRTNVSQDDLCLKESVEPIIIHKMNKQVNPIIKVETEQHPIIDLGGSYENVLPIEKNNSPINVMHQEEVMPLDLTVDNSS